MNYQKGSETKPESEKSWTLERKQIEENNYILSTSAYKPAGTGSKTTHRDPKEILKEIETEGENLNRRWIKLSV